MSQQTPAAAALINAVPVGAGATVAADSGTAGAANVAANAADMHYNANPILLQTQEFMAANGNIIEVDNIMGLLTPLTDDAVRAAIPDNMDLSSIGFVRQFFEEVIQIPRKHSTHLLSVMDLPTED